MTDMGMFDSFYVKDLTCPKGHKVSDELQTKSLMNLLEKYQKGKTVMLSGRDINCSLGNGWIRAWQLCEECDRLYYWRIIIRSGVFVDIRRDNVANKEDD